jgi:hypothetical protein
MKTENRNLNLENETKRTSRKTLNEKQDEPVAERVKPSQPHASTEQKQYPKEVGFHGTHDEKDLNPEE